MAGWRPDVDFGPDPRAEAFRGEVRAFFQAHLTDEVGEAVRRTGTIHDWGIHGALAAKGWLGADWPESF